LQFLSLENFGDVEIEEVAVEDGLDASSNDSNDVIESLAIVSVDPVEDVEATVGPESKQIVTGDAFCLASFGHHEELGQDCHALQVDREGPEDLHDTKLMVENQGEEKSRSKQKLNSKGIVITIVCCLKFHIHQIDCRSCTPNEEDLHGGVVQGDEAGQEIEISRHKHNQEQNL